MKKTALTMTDSEKTAKVIEICDSNPKSPYDENLALRSIVEQQEIAMDMIMTKYREQVDSLTKISRLDASKFHYKRYLNTIINQANKMDEMTKAMRKNLLIIFKYEEILQQIEHENERLRDLVRKLSHTTENKSAEVGKLFIDMGSQTNLPGNTVSKEDKSVGTSIVEIEQFDGHNAVKSPDKKDECTEMMLYTPLPDSFAYFGTIHNTSPAKTLDVDAAFDLYVNRFSEEAKKVSESKSPSNITLTKVDEMPPLEVDTEMVEDFSEGSSSTVLTEVDELSSEISILSLSDDDSSMRDSRTKGQDGFGNMS